MSPDHLRPLRVQEIVDAGFALARRSIGRTALLTVAFVAPIQVALWLAQTILVEDREALRTFDDPSSALGTRIEFDVVALLPVILQFLALVVALVVSLPVVTDLYGGQSATNRETLRRVGKRGGPALLIVALGAICAAPAPLLYLVIALGAPEFWLLFGLAVYVATALLGLSAAAIAVAVVAGPIALVAAWFAPCLPVLFIEETGPGRSVSRGLRLGGKRLWFYTMAMLLTLGIAAVAWISLQLVLALALVSSTVPDLAATTASAILGGAVAVLVGPAIAGVLTAIYYDARIRREGLDLAWELVNAEASA